MKIRLSISQLLSAFQRSIADAGRRLRPLRYKSKIDIAIAKDAQTHASDGAFSAIIAAAILFLGGATTAQATSVTLPPTSGYAVFPYQQPTTYYSTPGTYTLGSGVYPFGTLGAASAGWGLTPPYATTSATSAASSTASNAAQAAVDLGYYYELVGPASAAVTISVAFNEGSSASGSNALGEAEIIIYENSFVSGLLPSFATSSYVDYAVCTTTYNECSLDGGQIPADGYYQSINAADVTLTVPANTEESIELDAEAFSENFNPGLRGSSAASAYIDPTITIDTPDYTLAFSPGITNNPASVPEPSSLPLMLAGLGMIGGAFYFGRKKVRAS